MKKVLAFIMVAAMMLTVLAFSASAEGTYGEYEKKVIEVLGTDVELKIDGKLANIHIPDNYVNQAKAYFAGSAGDITEDQYEEILSYIEVGKKEVVAAVEADHTLVMSNGEVDIAHMPQETKSKVLTQGQKACEVVETKLVYTGEKVVITTESGEEVFNDEAVVKTTGADMSVALGMGLAMLALAAAAVFTAKKVKLF